MSEEQEEKPKKKRSLTSISLGWLAERLRKTERIQEQIESGAYQVDSEKIAASIANEES